MEALLDFKDAVSQFRFPLLFFLLQASLIVFALISLVLFVYDRFIQREDQLLINYPLIGRMRYLFYLLRDPMRQYFGDEKFYESFDKVKWVYDSAERKAAYASFSPGQPQKSARLSIKNANCVLNTEDVSEEFGVTFGQDSKHPFKAHSVLGRSAMSDGAISPEGTRAFSKGAYLGGFPINTGEGSLTSNFLYTHRYNPKNRDYLDVIEGTFFAKSVYLFVKFLLNASAAERVYRHMVILSSDAESYLFDEEHKVCYRVNWNAPLEAFPKEIPSDVPDIIFQIGSGLYGVRDKQGGFDEQRYIKSMRFARMTEIKMAQGAKQTGGKLLADKVSEAVAYYRGVEAHKDLFSPNRFPYGKTLEELFDFMGRLKELSDKPVGVKIVISSKDTFLEYASLIKKRVEEGSRAYPDFITIDGGDGGSGAAPLEMMMTVGMVIAKALYIADMALKEAGVREKVKLIASEKVLTPDDAIVLFGIGADYVGIARAFMMSAGCIRARECSGAHGRHCPVGLATQDKKKRASFLVEQKARNVASYHAQMIHGMQQLLAIMGVDHISKLNKSHLIFKDHAGKTYMNVDNYFEEMLV
ncbi:MAG: FMN-binding glutamate synthase family protein [Sulfurimonas sp.]|uniref:FMN-binding glutamate synthase family protein n=1 Tax=Sulfurimonas sp. TaxID=2022749 RepID=UPI0028CD7261|nr:FMN-binding glutamate synthase family protein [Sulfurimonas sp.]MDT8339291.1 FMN-binding glutamate synthase family protein [Sulfurimonas sp.]